MATRERVIFNLDRFEWSGPGWLQVWGGWDGMDRRDLADPVLVVHARGGSQRLVPPPDGIRGGTRNWHAIFPWEDDPAAIEAAELEFGGSLSVELPVPGPGTGRRRFGRTRLTVRELDQDGAPAVGEEPAAQPAHRNGPPPEAEPIAVHVAVVEAREETAQARDELELARTAVSRAAQDVEAEHARRSSDAERFQEALAGLRQLAEEGVQKERAVARRLSAELDGYESAVKDERALAAGLRDQLQSLSGELIESREILDASRAEGDGLRVRAEEVERGARRAAESTQAELESMRADLVESRQVAESWGAEADRVRAQAAEAQREAERAVAEAEQLRTHLGQAERTAYQAGGEVERLRLHLDEAQERVKSSGAEAEDLRAHFERSQRQAEQSSAEVERLRAHLERTVQQAQQSDAEAEQLRAELGATREAAQEAERLRAELDEARRGAQEAAGEAERARRSLAAVREALQQT